MTTSEAFANDKLVIHCPWKGCSLELVQRFVAELYGCTVEQWLANREQWNRDDAEDTRAQLYPTATELASSGN